MNGFKISVWSLAGFFIALIGILFGALFIIFIPIWGVNWSVNRYRKSVNGSIDHQVNVSKLKEKKYASKESKASELVSKYQTALDNLLETDIKKVSFYTNKLKQANKKVKKYNIRVLKYQKQQSILATTPQRQETTKINDFVNKIASKVSTEKINEPINLEEKIKDTVIEQAKNLVQ